MKNRTTIIFILIFTLISSATISFFIIKSISEKSENGEKSGGENEMFSSISEKEKTDEKSALDESFELESGNLEEGIEEKTETLTKTPTLKTSNCTTSFGELMLINPNFSVDSDFISKRKTQLINITELYGIKEGNQQNGVPLLDPEAAVHLSEMLSAYKAAYTGHEITTRSCFRSVGTSCGRLCYATGTSDHHSGYTCDLIDGSYGNELDTELYAKHPEWAWLHDNSYKYGFIDRFIESWAGGSMSEPVNVDENGTTGLFETWHYRYVGLQAAKEIATGKYNNGSYDSLEHYLKASGRVKNLLDKTSCN